MTQSPAQAGHGRTSHLEIPVDTGNAWVYPWARCDSCCFRCGLGEAARLNAADLRLRKPQSLHAPTTLA